jgi:RNA polymerase-binding transcription factor DksA
VFRIERVIAMDEARVAALLAEEEVRIRSVMSDLESGGVVGHSGLHEHLKAVEDTSMDGGSELAERSLQLGFLERLKDELEDVEWARRELEEGRYGRCRACGKAIADERLEVMPTTKFCVDHAAA